MPNAVAENVTGTIGTVLVSPFNSLIETPEHLNLTIQPPDHPRLQWCVQLIPQGTLDTLASISCGFTR